jgi:hypothetical protein
VLRGLPVTKKTTPAAEREKPEPWGLVDEIARVNRDVVAGVRVSGATGLLGVAEPRLEREAGVKLGHPCEAGYPPLS